VSIFEYLGAKVSVLRPADNPAIVRDVVYTVSGGERRVSGPIPARIH
jgi:acetaldehyde dehydrogenase (acetylating)